MQWFFFAKLYFPLLSVFLLSSIFDFTRRSISKYFFLFSSISFILFCFIVVAGGRIIDIGGDWSIYKANFDAAPRLFDFNSSFFYFEPGFLFLTSIIKTFSSNYVVFFIFVEMISCILMILSINKYTENKISSLCIYFSYMFISLNLNLIRTLLAVQIFFFSLRYIYNKNFFCYSICIFVASSMHISSLILFPLYFMLNKNIKKNTAILVIIGGMIMVLFRIDILRPILELTPSSLGYIYTKVDSYLNSQTFGTAREFSFTHIEYLIFFVIIIRYRDWLNKHIPYFNIFFNMFMIYGVLLFYLFGVNAFSGRFKFFFLPSIVVIIPYFLKLFRRRFEFMFLFFSLYLIALSIYLVCYRETSMLLKYTNYFF
ncbi:MAG: EpsG family protein [Treponema sp.]|jgi:hypothetical protein|nr:EpsG family protein [Treponema sp.]